MTLDTLVEADWPAAAQIYAEGIASGDATFETRPPTWEAWDAAHLPVCRLAARGPALLGWAALAPYSARHVYRGVAELSIYVAEAARGRGVGHALLGELVARADAAGFWTLLAGIFPENEASLRLHARHGFRVLGTHEGLGEMGGRWRDVVMLERRC